MSSSKPDEYALVPVKRADGPMPISDNMIQVYRASGRMVQGSCDMNGVKQYEEPRMSVGSGSKVFTGPVHITHNHYYYGNATKPKPPPYDPNEHADDYDLTDDNKDLVVTIKSRQPPAYKAKTATIETPKHAATVVKMPAETPERAIDEVEMYKILQFAKSRNMCSDLRLEIASLKQTEQTLRNLGDLSQADIVSDMAYNKVEEIAKLVRPHMPRYQ